MKVALIGSGNVATVLGKCIRQSRHELIQVLGRSGASTETLAKSLGTAYTTNPEELTGDADLYILAVQDSALHALLPRIHIPEDAIIVHTAGGVPIGILAQWFNHYGVLYPLQSLSKAALPKEPIPFFLDTNLPSSACSENLWTFARDLSDNVQQADDAARLRLHIAAVFASNFTNYLYVLAEQFCQKEDLPFGALLPLIRETSDRLTKGAPAAWQTGPAIRNDISTLERHMQTLVSFPEAGAVYSFLSDKIRQTTLIPR